MKEKHILRTSNKALDKPKYKCQFFLGILLKCAIYQWRTENSQTRRGHTTCENEGNTAASPNALLSGGGSPEEEEE